MTMTTELVELADRLEALAGALGNIDPDGGSAGYRLLGDAYGEAEELATAIRALASRAGGSDEVSAWRELYQHQTAMRYMDNGIGKEVAYRMAEDDVRRMTAMLAAAPEPGAVGS